MAMTKPIGFNVPSFDAKKPYLFRFETSGGNQVVSNRLIIKNNETNETIYNNIIESYKFEHELMANKLSNNKYYNYSFITYDSKNEESPSSNPIAFYCYSTPIVEITNIPVDSIIKSPNYVFSANYSQIEGELLNTFSFNLYDAGGNLLSNSGNLYNTNIPPLTFQFDVNGLLDDHDYKISCTAITINGNIVKSNLMSFGVNYFNPKYFSLFDLSNNCEKGYVEIKNNMKIIDGISNPSPPTYIEDTKIYLKDDGYYVKWIDGYIINNDFTIGLWFEQPNIGEDFKLCVLSNNNNVENNLNKMTLNLIKDVEEGTCAELNCYSGHKLGYYSYSNFIKDLDSQDKLFLWIRRIKNVFSIKLSKVNELYLKEEPLDNSKIDFELEKVMEGE